MNLRLVSAALVALSALSAHSQAQLIPRLDGQAVYDADRDFTVLANANLPLTERFGIAGINLDGSMSWRTALTWIDALNGANYLGYNDWRLPDGRDDGTGVSYCHAPADCADGELRHLWVELGGPDVDGGAGDITDSTDPDLALFYNFPNEYYKFYWEKTTSSRGRSWAYKFGRGGGTRHRVYDRDKATFIFVWPVRDGDVGPREIVGDAGFHNPADSSDYSWPVQEGVATCEVSRSDTPEFFGGCQRWETSDTRISDLDTPASGQAFFYLTRPLTPTAGGWGRRSDHTDRQGSCL